MSVHRAAAIKCLRLSKTSARSRAAWRKKRRLDRHVCASPCKISSRKITTTDCNRVPVHVFSRWRCYTPRGPIHLHGCAIAARQPLGHRITLTCWLGDNGTEAHYPCQGRRCCSPRGGCASPLIEALRPLGYQPLPTAEQGARGIDVMALWDGISRRCCRKPDLAIHLRTHRREAGRNRPRGT